MNILQSTPIFLLCLPVAGCSLFFGSNYQEISIHSKPPGAEVVINGEPVGKTPVQNYTVSRDSDAVIEVSLDGYLPVKRTTTRVLSVLGKADLLDGVCVLIPLIGLASPASQEHSPDQYTFILEPDTQAGESE